MISLRDPVRDNLLFVDFGQGVVYGCLLLAGLSGLNYERLFGRLSFVPLLVTIDRGPVNSVTSQVGEVESMLDDMGVYTFRSQADEMTVVWVYNRDQSPVAESDGSATLETQ